MSTWTIVRCVEGLLATFVLVTMCGGCAIFRPGEKMPESSSAASSSSDVQAVSYDATDSEPKKGLSLEDFYPDNIAKTVKKATAGAPNRDEARKAYDEADAQYRQAAAMPEGEQRSQLFVQAATKFQKAAEKWPNSAVQQDSLFMAGESYFFADYYWEANRSYEQLIKDYANSRYTDTVSARRFAIAKYWMDVTKQNPESFYEVNLLDPARPWRDARGHSLRIFDKIRVDDSMGRLADDATLAAANEYFAAGKYLKADEYYTDLRKEYTTSEHQFLAHYLGLKAKLESYIGPNYSGESLDEAEKLIKAMRRAFPQESEKEREYLDRASAEVRYKKAEKLWRWAKYYDKRAEYRAAIHYYERVMREYNDTPFARQSQERIPTIAALPPVPPQKFPWLVKIVPTNDKIKPLIEAAKKKQPAEEAAQP